MNMLMLPVMMAFLGSTGVQSRSLFLDANDVEDAVFGGVGKVGIGLSGLADKATGKVSDVGSDVKELISEVFNSGVGLASDSTAALGTAARSGIQGTRFVVGAATTFAKDGVKDTGKLVSSVIQGKVGAMADAADATSEYASRLTGSVASYLQSLIKAKGQFIVNLIGNSGRLFKKASNSIGFRSDLEAKTINYENEPLIIQIS